MNVDILPQSPADVKIIVPQGGHKRNDVDSKKKAILADVENEEISCDEKIQHITEILLQYPELQKIFEDNHWEGEKFVKCPDWEMAKVLLRSYHVRFRKPQACSQCEDFWFRGHKCNEEAAKRCELNRLKIKTKKIRDRLEGVNIPDDEEIVNYNIRDNDVTLKDKAILEVDEKEIILQFKPLSIFDVPSKISFVAWNAHKLSALGTESSVPIEQWQEICLEFSKHDVITLTEILPIDKGKGKKKFEMFFTMLKTSSSANWEYRVSDPAGPGKTSEVHVILVKEPIVIKKSITMSADIDYKPLVTHLCDERMKSDKFMGDFIVTSIHMPPPNSKERTRQRDAQIREFMKDYLFKETNRIHRYLTDIEARQQKEEPTIHIIQGDWNKWIGSENGLVDAYFNYVLQGNVTTTSGSKCYDNFLISNHYSKYFNIPNRRVLRFNRFFNARGGHQGLSDHAPIMFELEVLK